MKLKPTFPPVRARRVMLLALALLLAALPAVPTGSPVLAQTPPHQPPVFVNEE